MRNYYYWVVRMRFRRSSFSDTVTWPTVTLAAMFCGGMYIGSCLLEGRACLCGIVLLEEARRWFTVHIGVLVPAKRDLNEYVRPRKRERGVEGLIVRWGK